MTRTPRTSVLALLLVLGALAAAACGGGNSSPTSPSSSTSSSGSSSSSSTSSSHNAGRDCSGCHRFTVAGTAYRSDGTTAYSGAVIRLTTARGDNNSAVVTLTTDRNGNFYTNATLAFGQGLFATATGTTGTVTSKSTAITSGACNGCHAAGQRIIVN